MTDAEVTEPVDPSVGTPPRRPALAVIVTAAAVVLIVLTAITVYSLAAEYGSTSGALGSSVIWSLVPGTVLAMGLRLLFLAYAGRKVHWGVLLAVGILVAVVVIGAAAVLGNAKSESDQAAAAGACTDSATATLTSVPGYDPAIGTPTGQDDGSCTVTIAVRAEGDAALAQLTAAFTSAGWVAGTKNGYDAWLTKGDTAVGLDQRDTSKGYTDVDVIIPAG
jgi:hypothetical protein